MRAGFSLPRFYPILDTKLLAEWSCPTLHAAEGLIEGGARILQYRHKDDWTQAEFDTAKQLAALCREAGALFVLNDRADFAHLLGAALHVGQGDLPPTAARHVIGEAFIGFSTHDRLQLTRANDEPVDYVALGPIFSTTSKHHPDPVVGVEGLRKLRLLTKKPLVAIGGITELNACDAIEAGADSVAVISAIGAAGTTRAAMRAAAETWNSLVSQARAAR